MAPLLPPGLGLCLSWAKKGEKQLIFYVDLREMTWREEGSQWSLELVESWQGLVRFGV